MNAAAKLTGFAVVLGALFVAGAAVGDAVNPDAPGTSDAGRGHTQAAPAAGHGGSAGVHGAQPAATAVRGLAVAQDGLRLVLADTAARPGRTERLAFGVVDEEGAVVRDFDVAHEKRMHLIVVRRDLTGFQHLHPVQGADGTWSAPVTFGEPGSYRVFADFTRGGKAITLAGDLQASGKATLRPLPEPERTADAGGGLAVTRAGALRAEAGHPATLTFSASLGRAPAALQPYLGAGGHLVALREGDLAFLHVHPTDDPAAWAAGRVAFETQFPTPGRYRLFLQVQTGGAVRTAAFTQEVK